MGQRSVPPLLSGLVDDAAVFPPGNMPLPEAIAGHRKHRASWYSPLVGPLLLPASALADMPGLLDRAGDEQLEVVIIGDVPVTDLAAKIIEVDDRLRIRQVEAAVAKRGEDPQPGLRQLVAFASEHPGIAGYAEVPLAWGLSAALDAIAQARSDGVRITPKFRTGGLAAELFPTPVELAAVICACRDRGLPFKLTAGLHRAIRHDDVETGFTHHGFVNILAAATAAAQGAEAAVVAEWLATTDPVPLLEALLPRRLVERPLWIGFGSCSIAEPLEDLIRLGLLV